MENNESGFYDSIAKVTRTRGKITDPFEAAGALLGGVIGFVVVDIPALHIGIPPGTGAFLGSSALVGVVQVVKGSLGMRGNKKEKKRLELMAKEEQKNFHTELEVKAKMFRDFLVNKHDEEFLKQLDNLHEWWQAGIRNDKQFDDELEKLKTKCWSQYSA